MKAFRISRAPATAGEAAYDAFAKLVFEPPLESDELFDALREAYPSLKTHMERKKQAVLDFLMEERQAIEQEITAFVQQTGTPAPQADASYSARPSPAFSASSSLELRKFSTSNSASSSSSTRSAGSSPETMSLKDMTSVWTAVGHGKPKIHTRRSMTTKEKEEYRRRRQMKACKECRSRKRKCNHDPSHASSAASPRADAKVKKRASTTASSNPHPPQSFLSNEFDTAFLADSMSTDSPMDFLDFSPVTGAEGSFDDFLLLPQDEFSSIDFSTDPLFQPIPDAFSYDSFLLPQSHQQHTLSTGSRSPASTYQSSGMSRSGSNAMLFDASQSWSFDLDPTMDLSSQQAQHSSFASGSTDGKQAGLAAGVSQSSQRSTQSSPGDQTLISTEGLTPAPAASPGTSRKVLRFTEGTLRQTQTGGRTRRESWQSANEGVTATHTLNVHTTMELPGDVGVIPHTSPGWFNDGRTGNEGRNDNHARRDGLVLGTDPSAAARFGEHGNSRIRRTPLSSEGVNTAQHVSLQDEPFRNRSSASSQTGWTARTQDGEAPLASRNPTSVNDPTSSNAVASTLGLDNSLASSRSRQSRTAVLQSTLQETRPNDRVHDADFNRRRDGDEASLPTNTLIPRDTTDVVGSSSSKALATSRFYKGKNLLPGLQSGNAAHGVEKLSISGLPADTTLVAAHHTRPSFPPEADCASINIQRRSSILSNSSDATSSAVLSFVALASAVVSIILAAVVSALWTPSSLPRLIENARKASGRADVWEKAKANTPSYSSLPSPSRGATDACVSLLSGVSRSRLFVFV
ncbi:hypothetical protein MPH_12639 [Macrophomina phaseolina MS6]|uniref:Uncharacterized protein n=1 Tax=Macrophomina phaseolina (strain MS6) TaxID=1126212 RepID=K2RBJ8_MACPH|nr:hypothetical protein MPH_12639 [Macrophomina phaseolina MS6]